MAPPLRKKKVLVVGGGPAGMEAAITAARRGHEVLLYEKTDALGGALKFAEAVPFKQDLYRFTQCLIRRVESSGVKGYPESKGGQGAGREGSAGCPYHCRRRPAGDSRHSGDCVG